jgi:hypothetical protein
MKVKYNPHPDMEKQTEEEKEAANEQLSDPITERKRAKTIKQINTEIP